MKILFTHSYFLNFDAKQLESQTPYPPLATLYAAALLRENNFQVSLADIQFAESPKIIEKHILEFKPDILVIYDDGFNYLTKMCLTNMRAGAFETQAIAKKHNLKVIVSSSDATDHLQDYFNNQADFIIIGEAEHSLLEIVTHIKDGKSNFEEINGIAYLQNKTPYKTKPRIVLKDLDQLPNPAWDLIDITPYKKMWLNKHGYFSLNFVTTRGCPYKCNWCAKPIYGNRYNSHSAENTVNQIKHWQQKFGFTHVWFADDIFGLKPNWLKEFNNHIKQTNLNFTYKIQSRADLLLESENIRYLAESGCKEVWIGAESGSQKILDAMDKGTSISQIKEATALLKKYNIKPCFFLQFGYSGETIEDIKKTIELVNELCPADIGISVSYPLPGTKFYENVKSELGNKTNWEDSDDLDIMFKSTYSPDFYKILQRYVHYNYRQKTALKKLGKNIFSKNLYTFISNTIKKHLTKNKLIKTEPLAKSLF